MREEGHIASREPAPGDQRGSRGEAAIQSRIFDYRKGRSTWGHAIHSGSWNAIPAHDVETGRWPWRGTVHVPDRATVMIHAAREPEAGDRLLMSGQSGNDWNLCIVAVECCGNPRDMYTVTLEDDGAVAPVEASPRQVVGDRSREDQ